MKELTKKRLLEAGWIENRKVNIKPIENLYKSRGFEVIDSVKKFLEEFAMLEFEFPRVGSPFSTIEKVNFNPFEALGNVICKEDFDEIHEEYPAIEDIQDIDFYPLGEKHGGDMTLLMGSNGKFFSYVDGCLVKQGDNIEEMLDSVVGQYSFPKAYPSSDD